MVSAAAAQSRDSGNGLAPVGIYTGVETSPGICDAMSGMCHGNTFVLNSYGEWEIHHLTVSLNYSTNQFVPNNFIVSGGSWSLVIYRDNVYAGTLYGEVQTGSVRLITDGNGEETSKRVQASLLATGGLGMFAGKESENISGVYDATTNLRSSETTGSLYFPFR